MAHTSNALPPTRLEERLSYRCSLIATRITRFMAPAWEAHGLTTITWRVMAVIGRYEPVSAKEVAAHTSTDAYFVSRAIEQLTTQAFIGRAPDPKDRRRASLRLTPLGRRVHQQVEAAINLLEAELLAELPQKGREQLDQALAFLDQRTQALATCGKSWKDYAQDL